MTGTLDLFQILRKLLLPHERSTFQVTNPHPTVYEPSPLPSPHALSVLQPPMRDMTPTPSVRRRKRAVYVMMGLLAAFPSAAGASGEGSRPSVPGWTNTRGDGYPQVRLLLSGQWRPASVDISCVAHPNALFGFGHRFDSAICSTKRRVRDTW